MRLVHLGPGLQLVVPGGAEHASEDASDEHGHEAADPATKPMLRSCSTSKPTGIRFAPYGTPTPVSAPTQRTTSPISTARTMAAMGTMSPFSQPRPRAIRPDVYPPHR